MPFRKNHSSYCSMPMCSVGVDRVESVDNSIVTRRVDQFAELPDVHDFDPETLVNCGIPQEKISTILIRPSGSSIAKFADSIQVPEATSAPVPESTPAQVSE